MADQQEIIEQVVKRLEDSIGESIVENIKKSLQVLVKAEFERIDKRLDSVDRILSGINENLNDDRKDLGQIVSELKVINNQSQELLLASKTQTKQIVSKVTVELEKVQEDITKSTPEKVMDGITQYVESAKPKMLRVVQKARKPFWRFWSR